MQDALGAGVTRWSIVQRVGAGWYSGPFGICNPCREGDFISCETGQIPGITHVGGHADYMTAPAQALDSVPKNLSSAKAEPG